MRLWFTKGLSNTRAAISLILGAGAEHGFSAIASHVDPLNPLRALGADFIVEPTGISGDDYADWVLATALQHSVDLIIAQRQPQNLWPHRARFLASGVRLLIAATPETLALLDNKLAFQRDIAAPELTAAGVHGHDAFPFRDLDSFEAARVALAASASAPYGICVKPVTGIFGSGFRRIDEDGRDFERLLSGNMADLYRISLDAFRLALKGAAKPREMILMPYLPGVERSVDFVSHEGEMIAAVARVKHGKHQQLELSGPAIICAQVLAKRYRLNGLCNLQTREIDGRQVVLEINARMSGGMEMACLSGINLPWLAVRAALDLDLPPVVTRAEPITVTRDEVVRVVSGQPD